VHRLAEVSVNIIDQCVAQGVPFAREYGGTARQPLVSAARRCRARSTRAARPASSCCSAPTGAVAADRRRHREDVPAHRDARRRRRRRPRARHRHARPRHRRDRVARGRRGGARDRRLRQRVLPVDQREGLQRHGDVARAQARRRLRQPVLHADPPDLHPGQRRLPVEAHADVRVAAQRRPRLGAEEEGDKRKAREIPDGRARLLPRAQVPELRQPRPATSRRARRRRSATTVAASAGRPRRLPRLRRRHQAPGQEHDREKYGNLFDMYEKITARIRTRSRCGSTRPCTTRWAACGSTTT
jgi:hypothetical protein